MPPSPPSPPKRARSERASGSLARIAPQISRWIERLLAEHQPPLTVAQYLALEELDAGRGSATELAAAAGVSRSAASQLVGSLERAGLISGGESLADRRQRVLQLNADGRRVLRSARRLLSGRLEALLADLPRPEADSLARSLGRVEGMLHGTPPPRRPPHPRPPKRRR